MYNLLYTIVFFCLLVTVSSKRGTVEFSLVTPDHIIGNYTKGSLTLQFDSMPNNLVLKNGQGDILLDVMGHQDYQVKFLGTHFQNPKLYSSALVFHTEAGASPEMRIMHDAAFAVGATGITAKEYPGILPFYMASMHTPVQQLQQVESVAASPTPPVITNCTGTLGEMCIGMCGPRCNCWHFVCGDCCFHNGCYCHDLCCDSYFTWSCLFPFGFSCEAGYHCAANEHVPECSRNKHTSFPTSTPTTTPTTTITP